MTTDTTEITEEEYNAAIEKIQAAYGELDAVELIELLEVVRDDETLHTTDNEMRECVDDCTGCLTERIADAVTMAANR